MNSSTPRWAILAILVAYFAMGQFHRAAGSITTPLLIERLSIGATAISLVMAVMFFASVAAQLPMGAALDRIGARKVMSLTTILVAAGTALFALADEYTLFLAARILMGVGFAALGAATNIIVSRAFPARDFAYTQGRIVAFGAIGGLMGTYPLAVLLERFAWPAVFLTIAVLTLLLAFVTLRFLPRAPEEEATATSEPGGYVSLLRNPEMLKILALGIVVWAPIVVVTGLWGSAYFQEIHGLEAETAGAFIFAFYAATILGAYGFGTIERRIDQRKSLILWAAFLASGCYLALALIPQPGLYVAAGLLILMIILQQFHVALSAHLRAIAPTEKLGRASALFNLIAVVSIPSMQLGFGAVLDLADLWDLPRQTGYRIGFGMVGLLIGMAALVYSTTRQANQT